MYAHACTYTHTQLPETLSSWNTVPWAQYKNQQLFALLHNSSEWLGFKFWLLSGMERVFSLCNMHSQTYCLLRLETYDKLHVCTVHWNRHWRVNALNEFWYLSSLPMLIGYSERTVELSEIDTVWQIDIRAWRTKFALTEEWVSLSTCGRRLFPLLIHLCLLPFCSYILMKLDIHMVVVSIVTVWCDKLPDDLWQWCAVVYT